MKFKTYISSITIIPYLLISALNYRQLCNMAVNIGEKIRRRLKESRIGTKAVSEYLSTTKQNIYGIYKRKSIDTALLLKLSKILDQDFFELYSNEYMMTKEGIPAYTKAYKNLKEDTKLLSEQLDACKKELADLREKYDLQKKINVLLEGRKK